MAVLLSGYDARSVSESVERRSLRAPSSPAPVAPSKPGRLRPRIDDEQVARIQGVTARFFQVDVAVMHERAGRSSQAAAARQVAIYLARVDTDASIEALCTAFGVTRPAILHAIQAVEDRAALRIHVTKVRAALFAGE